MELRKAISKRKSVRRFKGDLTFKEIAAILLYATKIPSAGALYPLTVEINGTPWATFFIICADFSKTTAKYGDRGIRYVYMEAGHLAQNIQLLATEMGLGSCCLGAFNENRLKDICKLKNDPIYLVSAGHI